MQSVEPVLENAIKTLQKVVDVRGMGKKWETSSSWHWTLCLFLLNFIILKEVK
jgi:hypothetical protein